MQRIIASIVLTAAVSGCASAPVGPPPSLEPAATCSSEAQCDAMWSEALVQAQNLSGMRLQTATDMFAQTYRSAGPGTLSATIRKVPEPGGTTVFEAEFSCTYSCGHLPYQAVNLFTKSLKRAGAGFEPVAP